MRKWERNIFCCFVQVSIICVRTSGFLRRDHAIFTINRLPYNKSMFFGTFVVVTANIDLRDSNWQHSIGIKYSHVFFTNNTILSHVLSIWPSWSSINSTHHWIQYEPDKNVTESFFLCVHHVPLFFCLSPLPAHRRGYWLIKQFPLYP